LPTVATVPLGRMAERRCSLITTAWRLGVADDPRRPAEQQDKIQPERDAGSWHNLSFSTFFVQA
jgi:hypothetical protein